MHVVKTVEQARKLRGNIPGKVALVPTMGALHAGHMTHVEQCKHVADHVLVSIFVNPTQFSPGEDFDHYPRLLDADLSQCEAAGVAGVFVPPFEQMYPADSIDTDINVPALTRDLEGPSRPGHFNGVCRVVIKLLHIIQPHYVSFGRKDYQQLRVIQAMLLDLAIPVNLIEVSTVREPDGLAMSSRNQHLDPEQRKRAIGLYKALNQAKMMVEDEGEADPSAVEHAMMQVLKAYRLRVDYAVVRHPLTLAHLDSISLASSDEVVALVAGRLGDIRLIDNKPMVPKA